MEYVQQETLFDAPASILNFERRACRCKSKKPFPIDTCEIKNPAILCPDFLYGHRGSRCVTTNYTTGEYKCETCYEIEEKDPELYNCWFRSSAGDPVTICECLWKKEIPKTCQNSGSHSSCQPNELCHKNECKSCNYYGSYGDQRIRPFWDNRVQCERVKGEFGYYCHCFDLNECLSEDTHICKQGTVCENIDWMDVREGLGYRCV